MNRQILGILVVIAIPMGAILFNGCGPVEGMDNELALDNVSDNWIGWDGHVSEYGGCYDGFDNNGDGLKDSEDPDCHFYLGPIRDLSLAPYPIGSNFLPDIAKIPVGGPGWNGDFRNPEQISRWLRFLTDLNGEIEGLHFDRPGVDVTLIPLPQPLPARVPQGTFAHGNNNNLNIGFMHHAFLDHSFLPLAVDVAPVPVGPDGIVPVVGAVGVGTVGVGAIGAVGAEAIGETGYISPVDRTTGRVYGGLRGMQGSADGMTKPAANAMPKAADKQVTMSSDKK